MEEIGLVSCIPRNKAEIRADIGPKMPLSEWLFYMRKM